LALGDEVEGCVADLDGETELEVEETGLAAVAETGAGHADFCLAETGFFFRHPAEDSGTYLENKCQQFSQEKKRRRRMHTLRSSPYFSFITRRYGFVPTQFSHTDGTVDVFSSDFVDWRRGTVAF
jgi:hypothetical protein